MRSPEPTLDHGYRDFVVRTLPPFTLALMALVALAGDAPIPIAVLAVTFLVSVRSFLALADRFGEAAPGASIAVNLVIFTSSALLAGPDAPGAVLFIPPVVAVSLLLSAGPTRVAFLVVTNLLCLAVNLASGRPPLLTGAVGLALFGLTVLLDRLRDHVDAQQEAIERERMRSETLLRAVLPHRIAERIKAGEHPIADRFEDATVLFCDLKGFTPLSQSMEPEQVMAILDRLFTGLDEAIAGRGVEKIKTIGDAYQVASGLDGEPGRPADMVRLGFDMLEVVEAVNAELGTSLQLRVGLDCGPAVAGVIGLDRFVFDVWGDTVNTAARMESHGVPGRVQVTTALRERLGDTFAFEARGPIEVKGKGSMETWLVVPPESARG